MTAEHIHDALTLLPADLVMEADRKRSGRPGVLVWKKIAAMAACFALVLGFGWYGLLLFGSKGGATMEQAAAEVPMMQAEPENEAARGPAAEAVEETLCSLPTAPAEQRTDTTGSVAGDALCIDHSHQPAEPCEEESSGGWCGNMTAAVYIGETEYALSGQDAVALTDILYRLNYTPEALCRCMAELTADTEMGEGYEISLSEYFVRYDGGQAALTMEQAETLRRIIDRLGEAE